MSKLSEVFETIISQLHWGPSHRPFLEAVIAEHDALVSRVNELENKISDLLDPTEKEPTPEPQPEVAPVAPVETVTNPAEPVQTGIFPDLLQSPQPEPVPAGPTSAE